jgi:hypothetical protein
MRYRPRIVEYLGFKPAEPAPATFGQHLLAFRQSRGLTQRAAAEALGVPHGSLGHWERDRYLPPLARRRDVEARLTPQGCGSTESEQS